MPDEEHGSRSSPAPAAASRSRPAAGSGATVLVTGGAGFFGDLLLRRLLDDGLSCVSVDLHPTPATHPRLRSVTADIRDRAVLATLFSAHRFSAVFHCAALLAHTASTDEEVWSANVEGTRALVEAAAAHQVPKVIFISSNCLWAKNFHRPVTEDDQPSPVEVYGRSKWEGERILFGCRESFDTVVLRSPTIVASGRLGLLTILFDFIREGRRVWVVGDGSNRYQFVYGPDLAQACVLAMGRDGPGLYNVGSDDVKSMREVYDYVIDSAGTGARVASLPRRPAVAALRLAALLRVSPLGPYHWRMIAEDFEFDTSKAKAELAWQPSKTNGEMLAEAYKSYEADFDEIRSRTDASAHRQPAAMKAIRLVKWLS